MDDYERSRIEALAAEDVELRRLWQEHLDFERRLDEFEQLSHLTPQEELERKQIQKLKLCGKDRIASILERHRHRG